MKLFPYSKVRETQDKLISKVNEAITTRKHLIVHAPTGLGKTVATLVPALEHAIKNDLTIFFLTSRHTQHVIAVETLRQIKEKYDLDIIITDVIGKKWMCAVKGIDKLRNNEFTEFCKLQREERKCEFYAGTKTKTNKLSVKAKKILNELVNVTCHTEKLIERCSRERICPYEVAVALASRSTVVVTDYYYLFHPSIRELFFNKTGKKLEDAIIIIDEAHNLPKRVRQLMTVNLSSIMVKRGIKEAQKYNYYETSEYLTSIQSVLEELSKEMNVGDEKLISKKEFIEKINRIEKYEKLIADLEFIADEIRTKQRHSYVGSIGSFLDKWTGQDNGFTRICSFKNFFINLSYRCLDPSIVTSDVITNSYCAIAMSGTLTPNSMYSDLLGFPKDTLKQSYDDPFPKKNKLSLIVPKTTTKFSLRNEQQYMRISVILKNIVDVIPGNCAIFFPSYKLRDSINKYLDFKNFFLEKPLLTKQEKKELLDNFKKTRKGVLLAVTSGSFGEGIDLPNLLSAVIIVGLPLQLPDLETRELIRYYDGKFGKGWEYGYIYPAFSRCLQNAGRCIRSETDRGVIVFLDERYIWSQYYKCFPRDMNVKVKEQYLDEIKEFFDID